jgi:transcriptional regulator of arginine metabolism
VSRSRRLATIAQLLSSRRFSSQEELAKALARTGIHVAQATLSRDLRSLGVAKRANASGKTLYELSGPATETLDRERRLIDLRAFVNQVNVAQNLAIVRTPPGHANGVARAIDLAEFAGIVGSVAGDDTVLVVMKDPSSARTFKRQLDTLATSAVGAAK